MPEAAEKGYETRDANARGVAWTAAGLVVATIFFGLVTAGLYRLFERWHPSPAPPSRIAFNPEIVAPPPRLQVVPALDLAQYEAAARARLTSYGWVDRNAGVVHIPITRAIELLAARGLPTRGADTSNASNASNLTPIDLQKQKAEATRP